MTRIDFYTDAHDKLELVCKIAAKAVQAKSRMLILAPDGEQRSRLDKMLWMQPAIGFVPHCLASAPIADQTPVVLSGSAEDAGLDEILLNLADAWPQTFARFQRLIEIVSRDEADKALARERYRFYRDRGYKITTHNMAALERARPSL